MSGNKLGIKFYILIFYNFYYNNHVLLMGCLSITFIKVKNITYKKYTSRAYAIHIKCVCTYYEKCIHSTSYIYSILLDFDLDYSIYIIRCTWKGYVQVTALFDVNLSRCNIIYIVYTNINNKKLNYARCVYACNVYYTC